MSLRAALQADIAAFIRTGTGTAEALALHAWAWQRSQSPALAAMFPDARPQGWLDIPAVPVSLFKELDLGPQPPLPTDSLFRTSGTTGQVRGVHRSRDTVLYDLGAALHARARIPSLPTRVASLCPADADSSLGHMVAHLAQGTVLQLFADGQVAPNAWELLAAERGPLFLAATAFALDALLAQPGAASWSADSVVMVTGGFKGRAVRLDAPSLYRALGDRFGQPRVVGEYGMTELGSQLWTDPVPAGEVPGAFVAPRWLKVYAVDPLSNAPVSGEGLLRFVDLANLDSGLCIETQDLGVVEPHDSGDRVLLRGRLEGAELRGCSLRAER